MRRNGFTASTNREVIPEWKVTKIDGISIREGAELHMVIEGKDEIIARFGKKQFEKVRHQYVED